MSNDTPTSSKLTGQPSNPLTSCAGDSRANHSVSQASEKEQAMNDGSGQSLLDASKDCDQLGCCSKTCLVCGQQELTLFDKTSLDWDTRAGHFHFLPVCLARHIHGDACSLFPTPRASDANGGGAKRKRRGQMNLRDVWKEKTGHWRMHPCLSEWLMNFPTGWTDLEQ